jgi:hypothetical protein
MRLLATALEKLAKRSPEWQDYLVLAGRGFLRSLLAHGDRPTVAVAFSVVP